MMHDYGVYVGAIFILDLQPATTNWIVAAIMFQPSVGLEGLLAGGQHVVCITIESKECYLSRLAQTSPFCVVG